MDNIVDFQEIVKRNKELQTAEEVKFKKEQMSSIIDRARNTRILCGADIT